MEMSFKLKIPWLFSHAGINIYLMWLGDEIQEWNDQSLVDCTFEEVVESINSSMEDNQDSNELHLIVCREK